MPDNLVTLPAVTPNIPVPRSGVLAGALKEEELAQQLDCCTRTLADKRRSGDHAPFFKFGGHVYYNVEKFRAWLESKEKQSVRSRVRTPRKAVRR